VSYQPKFTITSRLLSQIDEIAVTRDKILVSKMRMPHRSTGMKGHSFTLEKVRALANGEDFPVVAERSTQDVLNYFAMRLSNERKSGRSRWTHEDIFKLHRIIASRDVMGQGAAGQYRTIPVRAGRFVPPPPQEVSRLMSELLEWWNTNGPEMPVVLTSAIVHYRISAIHPFPDGNGRLGRALGLWELHRSGFDGRHILPLNERYWGERRHYYAALRAVRLRREDLTGWLEYSAEGLRLTLERTWMRAQQHSRIGGCH